MGPFQDLALSLFTVSMVSLDSTLRVSVLHVKDFHVVHKYSIGNMRNQAQKTVYCSKLRSPVSLHIDSGSAVSPEQEHRCTFCRFCSSPSHAGSALSAGGKPGAPPRAH